MNQRFDEISAEFGTIHSIQYYQLEMKEDSE